MGNLPKISSSVIKDSSWGLNFALLHEQCLSCAIATKVLGFHNTTSNWANPWGQKTCHGRSSVKSCWLWRMRTRKNWQIESPSKERDWRFMKDMSVAECLVQNTKHETSQNTPSKLHIFTNDTHGQTRIPAETYDSGETWSHSRFLKTQVDNEHEKIKENPNICHGFSLQRPGIKSQEEDQDIYYIYIYNM